MREDRVLAESIQSELTDIEFATSGARLSLFVLEAGSGHFTSDDFSADVEAPCLIWSPTQITSRMALRAGTRGFVLRIPELSLGRALPSGPAAAHVRQALKSRIVLPQLKQDHIDKLRTQFELIAQELFDMDPFAQEVIHDGLSIILVQIWRAATPATVAIDASPLQISDDFIGLVEMHMQSHWTVADYAQKIGVSAERLNTSVRRTLGRSAHQHIQGRMMDEARLLLINSNLTVAEVAYQLGFSDAAYFNRYFQRHAAIPPGKFRKIEWQRRLTRERSGSFAAWP